MLEVEEIIEVPHSSIAAPPPQDPLNQQVKVRTVRRVEFWASRRFYFISFLTFWKCRLVEFLLSFAECWELAGTGLREVWWVLQSHLGSVSSFAFYSSVTGASCFSFLWKRY